MDITVSGRMMMPIAKLALLLFVPADRPERIEKAARSGADAVIVDLEDAVAADRKVAARASLAQAVATISHCPLYLRINAVGTSWHDDDVSAAVDLPIAGVLLPKAESAEQLKRIRRRIGGRSMLAIVESAVGLANVNELAQAADRLVFGSLDFAVDLGCAHSRDALLLARSSIVVAARLAAKPAPIDGVTQSIHDEPEIEADARYSASLGFGGKLLIHPAQIAAARRGFAPSREELDWATRVMAATVGAAVAVDGAMVDAPVLERARQIIQRSGS